MPPDAVPPDEPTPEEDLERLDQDTDQTPFRPADNASYQADQAQEDLSPLQPTEDDTDDPLVIQDEKVVQPDVGDISSTHPQTDTNLEPEEYYDEGISGAAEAGEPNAGNEVVGYHKPEKDKDET